MNKDQINNINNESKYKTLDIRKIHINEKEHKALFDTGASESFIGLGMLKKLNEKPRSIEQEK